MRPVLWVMAAVVLIRLPFLAALPSPDEAGLLIVGGQWHDGASLYGDFWVDRSPMLLGVYEIAAELGGVIVLRLLGLVAVITTVLLCALTARRLGGERAAFWAAATAALLTASPWLGTERVNAEILATPWIALGVYAAVRAVEEPRLLRWPAVVGAATLAAVATKQNLADAGIFLVALLGASVVARSLSFRAAVRIAVVAALGAVAAALLLVLWAWARGTTPADLFDALFAFRLRAADVLSATPTSGSLDRRTEVWARSVLTGHVILVVAVLLAPWWRRFRSPATVALALTTAYGCFSVVASGSWWSHYLVQLAVPVAIGVGLVAARTRRIVPVVVAYGVAAALVGVAVMRPLLVTEGWQVAIGRMIAEVAEPDDTVVNAWGRPDLVLASGLRSPYEHLWSLPIRTDDPQLDGFRDLLDGPDAPTWLVTPGSLGAPGITPDAADADVERLYRPVATLCGREILLRRDIDRPVPSAPADLTCRPSDRWR